MGLDSYIQQFGTFANFHRLFLECVSEAEARTARAGRGRARSGARRA
jgi:hypothetical protein